MDDQNISDRPGTAQKMYALIREQQISGITVKKFCAQHCISQGSFYYWLKKYRPSESVLGEKMQGGFKVVQVQEEQLDRGTDLFAEYNGLKIYQQVPASFLKDLMS